MQSDIINKDNLIPSEEVKLTDLNTGTLHELASELDEADIIEFIKSRAIQ